MILYFIAGWIAGVVGTLWFGKWLTKREEQKKIENIVNDMHERFCNHEDEH